MRHNFELIKCQSLYDVPLTLLYCSRYNGSISTNCFAYCDTLGLQTLKNRANITRACLYVADTLESVYLRR